MTAAPDTSQAKDEEEGGKRGEDVLCAHVSPHLREEFLLTPRGGACIEQRCAGFEQTQVVRGENR